MPIDMGKEILPFGEKIVISCLLVIRFQVSETSRIDFSTEGNGESYGCCRCLNKINQLVFNQSKSFLRIVSDSGPKQPFDVM